MLHLMNMTLLKGKLDLIGFFDIEAFTKYFYANCLNNVGTKENDESSFTIPSTNDMTKPPRH